MKIYSIHDAEFARYGRVLTDDCSALIAAADTLALPETDSAYRPTDPALEAADGAAALGFRFFGGMPCQMGICLGYNSRMDAMEWHKSPELNIAVTDLILLLGDVHDLEEGGRYDSARVQAFRLHRGDVVEIFGTTLHFCPIQVKKSGFSCIVGLSKGVNTPLEQPSADPLLFKCAKWLIAHEDNTALTSRGVVGGIYGENYTLEAEE